MYDRARTWSPIALPLAFSAVFLVLLSMAASADRISIACMAVPVAACFCFLSASGQRCVWFAAVPWVILLNLLSSQADSSVQMPFYHSEAVLLLTAGVLARNLGEIPAGTVFAQLFIAGFAAWSALAAIMGATTAGWESALSTLRMALLALLTFRIAVDGASQMSIFAGSATLFVGLLGGFAWLEALSTSDPYFYRSVGRLVGGSELLAIHLSLYLPLALGYGFAGQSRKSIVQMGVWLAILLGASGLVLSYSRSGWTGGLVGACFVLGTCWLNGLLRWTTGIHLASVVAILGITAVAVASPSRIAEWADALISRLRSLGSLSVLGDRTSAWSVAVVPLRDSPFFGDLRTPNCYNLFLGIAARAGWPALLLWLGAVIASTQGTIRYARQILANPLVVGLVGGLIAFLITGIGESSLGEWVSPVFFTVLGLIAANSAEPKLKAASSLGVSSEAL